MSGFHKISKSICNRLTKPFVHVPYITCYNHWLRPDFQGKVTSSTDSTIEHLPFETTVNEKPVNSDNIFFPFHLASSDHVSTNFEAPDTARKYKLYIPP
jgi:hypothetical protein